MKMLVTALLTLVLGGSAQARNLYNFHSLGFSKDGNKYAYAESAVLADSGFKSAYGAIVDVTRNIEISTKQVILESERSTEIQAVIQVMRDLDLPSHDIHSDNQGQTLLNRLPTDMSDYTTSAFAVSPLRTYYLKIEMTPMMVTQDCPLADPVLLRLIMRTNKTDPNFDLILQNDIVLTKRRACAYHYSISKVIRDKDSLVVILNFHVPAFEGPDVHFMAVTGRTPLR